MTGPVPLVDLSGWYSDDEATRRRVAEAVDAALTDAGFLLIVGFDWPDGLTDDVRAEALRFFHRPAGEKEPYAARVGGRGWLPSGVEANAASDGVETPPDLKESYSFGREPGPDSGTGRWYPANAWPDDRPEMPAVVGRFAAAAARLADDLLEIFAAALRVPADFFTSRCDRSPYQVNLNWYPSREHVGTPAPNQFRIGQHTDFGTITILDRQPGSGGLQVRTRAGEWIDAPFVPGSLTVNTGDLFARWTGDRWRSTPHRVLPPPADDPGEELVSLVFFHEANPDTTVETLPSDTPGPNRYEPVNAGDFLAMRLASIDVGAAVAS